MGDCELPNRTTRALMRHQLAMIVMVFLWGCQGSQNQGMREAAGPLHLKDDLGRTISFEHGPQRVVSLAPSITETIYAVGGQDRLVGVTAFCDYPAEARSKPKVGDFSNPSVERILSLKPDLVLLASVEQKPLLNRLEAVGLKTFVVQPESLRAIFTSLETIGGLLGKETQARSLADSLRRRAQEVVVAAQRDASGGRPRVFVEIAERPLMTVGNATLIGELIRLAGGENIATGLARSYCVINPERVIRENPDVIIVADPPTRRDDVLKRSGWERISAVRQKRVYDDIDPNLIVRPGPRVVEGLRELHRRFYGSSARAALEKRAHLSSAGERP